MNGQNRSDIKIGSRIGIRKNGMIQLRKLSEGKGIDNKLHISSGKICG